MEYNRFVFQESARKQRGRILRWVRGAVRWSVALAVLPALLLVGTEYLLRAAGFGHSTQFFLVKHFDGQTYYVTHKDFFQQFFALPIDDMWTDAETLVPATKPKNTYRVVVLGESAALGVPPDFAFGFGRVLETMLRATFQNTAFDVYTFAQPAVDSYVNEAIARACVVIKPDAYVLYMGNNEVNGPFGPRAPMKNGKPWPLWLVRARMWMTDLRIGQLVAGHGRVPWHAPESKADQTIPMNDPRLGVAEKHFRRNIEDICEAGVGAGAKVLVCTAGCNLRDWKPTLSSTRIDLAPGKRTQWEALYQKGVEAQDKGAFTEARRIFADAAALDDTHAELQFRLGRCCWETGDYATGKDHFVRAWDCDLFHSRVMRSVNAITESVAKTHGVQFIDTARQLAEKSPNGVPGNEFFYDGVHLTFAGNYLIAKYVFDSLVPFLPPHAEGAVAPSEAQCAERLGLTPVVRKQHVEEMRRAYNVYWNLPTSSMEDTLRALDGQIGPNPVQARADGYRRALEFAPHDRIIRTRYAEALVELNQADAALEQARALLAEYPYRCASHRFLAAALQRAGKADEMLDVCVQAVRRFPDDSMLFDYYGQALAQKGDIAGARDAYRRAILANPRYPEPYNRLDALYSKSRDADGRAAEWRGIVGVCPDAGRAHACLGISLETTGRLDEAIASYKKAVDLNPFDPAFQISLGLACLKKEDFLHAIPPLQKALEINPDIADVRPLLIDALRRVARYDDAWAEVSACRSRGIAIPAEILDKLVNLKKAVGIQESEF